MANSAKEILVWSEKENLLRELLGQARRKADTLGWEVSVLAPAGEVAMDAAALAAAGADIVYSLPASAVSGATPDAWTALLSGAVQKSHPSVILVGATKLGLEIAPRIAERLGGSYAAWVVNFDVDPVSCAGTAQSMLYSGQGKASLQFQMVPAIMAVAPGVFAAQELPGRTARQESLEISADASRMSVLEVRPKGQSSSRLEDAKLVVDVGQGVRQQEDLELLRSLASLLDGQLGCSRPVASDRDWFPEWLGLSGKKVSPELCLTIGVSGAIQHIVGIRDSRLIAAVNNDENAAIFSQADYGVVADLYEFLPIFMERMKARGVRPAWLS
jgi:electron transfer flavoprotein alpha subunit